MAPSGARGPQGLPPGGQGEGLPRRGAGTHGLEHRGAGPGEPQAPLPLPGLGRASHALPCAPPSRQELPVVAPSRAMPEEAYRDLLEKAGAYPLAYWRPLLRVLLVLLGEVGLTVKEAVELWQEDVREKVLLVRGAKLREVPLSPSPGRSSPTGSPRGPSSPPTSPSPTPTSSSSPPRGRTGGSPLAWRRPSGSSPSSRTSPG